MQQELLALEKNDTWVVTNLPKGKKAIGSKQVYKIKYKPNGEVERLKTRLVVKGYNQIEGLDCKDRFSHVAKLTTIRILIALATAKQWPIFQLDTAFLHGYLSEKVYILSPQGYHKALSSQVCLLKKFPSWIKTSFKIMEYVIYWVSQIFRVFSVLP